MKMTENKTEEKNEIHIAKCIKAGYWQILINRLKKNENHYISLKTQQH